MINQFQAVAKSDWALLSIQAFDQLKLMNKTIHGKETIKDPVLLEDISR